MFLPGTKVIIKTTSSVADGGFNNLPCKVSEERSHRAGAIFLVPLKDRPDDAGRAPFIWDLEDIFPMPDGMWDNEDAEAHGEAESPGELEKDENGEPAGEGSGEGDEESDGESGEGDDGEGKDGEGEGNDPNSAMEEFTVVILKDPGRDDDWWRREGVLMEETFENEPDRLVKVKFDQGGKAIEILRRLLEKKEDASV